LFDQVFIDGAQRGCSGTLTKLVKHPHIRRAMPVMEMSKAPPVPLLWKQANQGVETVRRGQQRQQMNPPKLGGAEMLAWPRVRSSRQEGVDERVGNKR
jgi:hypothetical protein